jgi:hypothetical protein
MMAYRLRTVMNQLTAATVQDFSQPDNIFLYFGSPASALASCELLC